MIITENIVDVEDDTSTKWLLAAYVTGGKLIFLKIKYISWSSCYGVMDLIFDAPNIKLITNVDSRHIIFFGQILQK